MKKLKYNLRRCGLGACLVTTFSLCTSQAFAEKTVKALKHETGDPVSSEQLLVSAEQARTTLLRIGPQITQLEQLMGTMLPDPAKKVLDAMTVYTGKAKVSADDALAWGYDEAKLKFNMATLISRVELLRSALTRLKLSLGDIQLSSASRGCLEQLEKEIDGLQSLLQGLRISRES